MVAPLMLPLQGRSRIVTASQGALRDPGLCEKTPLGFGDVTARSEVSILTGIHGNGKFTNAHLERLIVNS